MPAAAMPHIFLCVQGGAKEVLSLTQETWCPSTRNSTPMPSCADEDATCEVPRDGRNRRPPSLLAEALSSACPVPTPRVFHPARCIDRFPHLRCRVLTLLPGRSFSPRMKSVYSWRPHLGVMPCKVTSHYKLRDVQI